MAGDDGKSRAHHSWISTQWRTGPIFAGGDNGNRIFFAVVFSRRRDDEWIWSVDEKYDLFLHDVVSDRDWRCLLGRRQKMGQRKICVDVMSLVSLFFAVGLFSDRSMQTGRCNRKVDLAVSDLFRNMPHFVSTFSLVQL